MHAVTAPRRRLERGRGRRPESSEGEVGMSVDPRGRRLRCGRLRCGRRAQTERMRVRPASG